MTKTLYYKESLKNLKNSFGGASETQLAKYKKMNLTMKVVRKSIEDGNQTVPEISEVTGIPSYEVLFAINALRRWFGLQIINKSGDYPEYQFKEDRQIKSN